MVAIRFTHKEMIPRINSVTEWLGSRPVRCSTSYQEREQKKTINGKMGEERTMVQENLRIEVPVEHVDAVKDHFYLVFSKGVDKNFSVTGHMEFIPKRLSAKISKRILCNWACKQNQ